MKDLLSVGLNMTSGRSRQPQRAKKAVSDSPGLMDFGMGQVDSVLNLPDGQVKIFEGIQIIVELL